MNRVALARVVCCVALLWGASGALAHDVNLASGTVKILPDGRVHIALSFDVMALALNDSPDRIANEPMDALLDGPVEALKDRLAEGQQRFSDSFAILADGKPVKLSSLSFPTVADVMRWKLSGVQPRLPVMLELFGEASIPRSTRAVAFVFPEVMGQVVLTVERPNAEPRSFALEEGRPSPTVPIVLATTSTAPAPLAAAPREPSRLDAIARYIILGYEHILPRGADHILFVLGLFLLSPRIRPLLSQVTAFTIAHSVTLALSLYGVVRLPPAIVEPLIAGSIAFVAIENIFTSELKPWRPLVVFGFGLVHGLGFAGVLTQAGLPRNEFLPALLSFNVGIELGQLSIIALAFLAVGWFRRQTWYRRAIVIPASAAIACAGLIWMIQRIAMNL